MGTVSDMFAPTAAEKGVVLRRMRRRARTILPPLVVIASNHLSNAIKHAGQGAC